MSATSPFLLENESLYQSWRTQKLNEYPANTEQFIVDVQDISAPTEDEIEAINTLMNKSNLVIYRSKTALEESQSPQAVQNLVNSLGIYRCETHRSQEDHGLVRLELSNKESKRDFIPYTNKALSWHTDGYYNKKEKRIKSISIHCVRPAKEGGVNKFFDHELAYLRMRDENPDFLKAWKHRRTMTIPPFSNDKGECRPESAGSIFGVDRFYGSLHMRFTARKHNIAWRDDQTTKDAYDFLMDLLENDPAIITYKLEAGEGVLCNNVLHNRTGFEEDADRLLLRGRYHDRFGETCPNADQLANKHYIAGVWS